MADQSMKALLLDEAAGPSGRPLRLVRGDNAGAPPPNSAQGPRASAPSGALRGSASTRASPAPPMSTKPAVGTPAVVVPGLGPVHRSHGGASVGPVAVATAAAGLFEHHPLFPREDGSPETRDIQFVSFCRKRTGDQAMQNCPGDIPARDVKSWSQVVEWWGGGEYKAIAKDGKHRMVAWYPSTGGEWLVFDGDSKPFTPRNGKGYGAPASTPAQPSANAPPPAPAPAPAAQDGLLRVMTEVLHELRNPRVARHPPAPANDGALVARIQANAQQVAVTAANAQLMQTMLSVVTQRPSDTRARPAEPTILALELIGAVQKLVPAPVAQPGLAEQLSLIKALRDLTQPTRANELQPFVDIFGQVIAADAARTQAEPLAQTTRPLVHVPGVGMVEVVAPDAGALAFGDMSTEERAAAIRNDPALLRELGIGLPPPAVAPAATGATAQPSPASPASPVRPPVVESVPAIPAVPDLEPPPVLVVAATPPVSSSTVSPAPSVVATAPPEPATVATASPVSSAPPAASSVVAARPVELPTDARKEERPLIVLPAHMPVTEPPHATDPERQRAVGELKRLTSLTHEERVAALRKLRRVRWQITSLAPRLRCRPTRCRRSTSIRSERWRAGRTAPQEVERWEPSPKPSEHAMPSTSATGALPGSGWLRGLSVGLGELGYGIELRAPARPMRSSRTEPEAQQRGRSAGNHGGERPSLDPLWSRRPARRTRAPSTRRPSARHLSGRSYDVTDYGPKVGIQVTRDGLTVWTGYKDGSRFVADNSALPSGELFAVAPSHDSEAQ